MIKKTKLASPPAEAAPPDPATLQLPAFSGAWRLMIYPLSVFLPGLGLAMGLLYFRQQDRVARNFGRICLALGLAGALLRAMHGVQPSDSLTQPLY